MLSLSKHLYRFVASIGLLLRARCFDKLSMTFFLRRHRRFLWGAGGY
ncbi:hypothetical protein HNP98_003666 [Hymenobacter sp. 9A]|uniref:Uncharacterized protein n=1 Tax=Hymenobacter caeli TaxID=2735894 RepID=A0ABX2FWP7_9BACT|nr:hypothetical protein [Hymenobacter caeli]